MSTPAATSTGDKAAQLLTGALIGAVLVFVGLYVTKGFAFGLVVLVLGLAYLARNRPRVGWVARGMAISGLAALAVLVGVLASGHDLV